MNTLNEYELIAEKELAAVLLNLKDDIDKRKITKDGIKIHNILRKLGWDSVAHCGGKTHSKLYYSCGYNGAYQQAKLVKVFGTER